MEDLPQTRYFFDKHVFNWKIERKKVISDSGSKLKRIEKAAVLRR